MKPSLAILKELTKTVEDYVCWSGGIGREWEGSVLTDPQFLADLVTLACHSSAEQRRTFMQKYSDVD